MSYVLGRASLHPPSSTKPCPNPSPHPVLTPPATILTRRGACATAADW
eukprot:COSAG02_NODE_4305_length_5528_cov_18.902376_3_plen_48_part_00